MTSNRSITTIAALLALACAPATTQDIARTAAPESMALEREQTADQQVRHVLNRLAFGARPGDVERVRSVGVDRWIATQLQPSRIRDTAAERIVASLPTLSMSSRELLDRHPPPQIVRRQQGPQMSREDSMEVRRAAQESRRVLTEMQTAKVARAVASERQLEEVMVDFWENHFTVFAGKGPERYFIASYQRESIRPHALGTFRDLLGAVARSPAMLFYLDNWQSAVEEGRPRLECAGAPGAGRNAECARRARLRDVRIPDSAFRVPGGRIRGLNENYARELLELHTLGVDGGYTQEDILNVARAFTGWTLEQPRRGGGFVFRPVMHDAGEKTVLGHRLAPGRAIEDGEQVLDIVADHPSTARFIATKLARRFVSDDPPETLVERAAETFNRTDGDIREVVRTIVTSPEFFASAAYRAKVKSPFELVVSALRAVNAVPDMTPRTAQLVARLGQPLYLHQAPNGWPERGEAWINTGAILNRINFGLALAGGALPGARPDRWTRYAELARDTRPAQVDGVIGAFLGGEASAETRGILEKGENPLQKDCAGAPRAGQVADCASPTSDSPVMGKETAPAVRGRRDPLSRPQNLDGLPEIIGLALGAPEFQRR